MPGRKRRTTAIFVVFILVLGLLATWFTWNYTTRKLAEDALEQASPDYLRIKEQLTRIRLAHRTCRFLYIMGRHRDGTVFFFLDSQPEDSKDYAPPGLVYNEVSDEYLYTFDTGKEQTVGPIEDRWGTLITSGRVKWSLPWAIP